ncbi:MAG: phage minor head protein [bacterium]
MVTDSALETRVDRFVGELITRIFSNIRIGLTLRIKDVNVQATSDLFARRANAFHKAQVDRQFETVLGLKVLSTEKWLEPLVSSFVEKNVTLIKSIPADSLKKVEDMVRHTVERGVSTEALIQNIVDEFGLARNRAHLIARDQIAKYLGKMTELRQKDVGVTEYIWSTSKDERVRPKHAAVDGQKFSWDDPPAVGSKGEKYHPGQDYQCRCVALPVLDQFFQ